MDRIFIPTVNRVNDQITLGQIPKSLKNKVTLVVQSWERKKYKYDVDYLVLPKHINLDDYLCLSKSRKIIYEEGKNLKYCVLDDDLIFKRRNQKRFGLPSNMEKSSRICNEEDMVEMFNLYSNWLSQPNITFCGGCRFSIIPQTKEYLDNKPIFSQLFLNGSDIFDKLNEFPLTEVRYDEDVLFILSLFSKGFGSRESQTFGFDNISLKGKIEETVWKDSEFRNVWRDHRKIEKLFPQYYNVLLDENGKRVKGGFRNYGKTKVFWGKCFKSSQNKIKNNINVVETVKYDKLLKEVDEVENYELGYQPPKPKKKKDVYPFTLKVHIWKLSDVENFCKTINKSLTSDDRKFTYNKKPHKNPKYVEKRKNPFVKKTTHKERIESELWKNTVEYWNDGWKSYITFEITFNNENDLIHFTKLIKVRVSLNSPFITYPIRKPKVWKYWWVCKNKNVNPQYPIYVVSKNRGDSRLTIKCLERLNIPYYVVIEPQNYGEYKVVIDKKKILVLPYSNSGDGVGRSRNWVWDHSKQMGFKRHWVMDDNIVNFHRLYGNRILPIGDGGMFRVCEEFVDRFKNVPISGLQYDFFCIDKQPYPPFVRNSRIYSVLLIENSSPFRWRGRYNEDTIISLDCLKYNSKTPFDINTYKQTNWSGEYCTIQFNCLLQQKSPTQLLGGGNSDEFYFKEGTYNKSKMLEVIHTDVSDVKWKYNRFHHQTNYLPFKNNKLKLIDGYDPKDNKSETDLFEFERVKDYFK